MAQQHENSLYTLSHYLRKFGIESRNWGQNDTKHLSSLLNEINEGESSLKVQNGKLYRVVSVAKVKAVLKNSTTGKVLIEIKQQRNGISVPCS